MADNGYAKMLLEKRANVYEQAKALLDRATDEKRELTAEEQVSYDKHVADMRTLREQADKVHEADQSAKAAEEALRKLAESPVRPEGSPRPKDGFDAKLRSFLRRDTRELVLKGSPEQVRSLGITPGLNIRSIEKRALEGGPGAAAGAGHETVPTNFYNKLWASLINTAQLLKAGVTVLQTDNGDQLQIPSADTHSTGAWVAEGASIGESDPHFVQRELGAYKAALLIGVSRELVDDTGVDLEGYLSMEAGRAVGNTVGQALVVGTGSGQPTGIINNATQGTVGKTGVTGAMNFDDVIALFHSVIPAYRSSRSAAFVCNDGAVGTMRSLKDNYGRYLWSDSMTVGEPDTILGKPVVVEPYMPSVALNAKSLLFGDLSAYFARIVNGIRFEQSIEYAFSSDLVTFRCILRADGVLVDQTGAVKFFQGAAS